MSALTIETWMSRLACPLCGGHVDDHERSIRCVSCSALYQVKNGVPVLLLPELINIDEVTKEKWLSVQNQMERTHKDADGDSYRKAMADAHRLSGLTDVVEGYLWESRLFDAERKHVDKSSLHFRERLERNRKTLAILRQSEVPLRDKIVLNIGPGVDTDLITGLQNEGAEVMNCDLIPSTLSYLIDHGVDQAVAGDIRSLPFQSETMDIVMAADVLHHSHPVNLPLQEILRVLKPGGILCMTELNGNHNGRIWRLVPRAVRRFLWFCIRRIQKSETKTNLESPYEDIKERAFWLDELRKSGFTETEVTVLNYLIPVFSRVVLNGIDRIATVFDRFLSPYAWRYIYITRKSLATIESKAACAEA